MQLELTDALPLKNSIVPQPGGGGADIKWNSPMVPVGLDNIKFNHPVESDHEV